MKRLLLIGCLSLASAQAQEPEPVRAERVAILQDKRINESSGLALSQRHPLYFWTHNDSANEPCLFAVDRQGRTLAKVRLPNAVNFDWEDLASGRDAAGEPVLYVADIGDNLKVRASLQIYQIPEPELPTDPDKEISSANPLVWHFSYPDGHHNAETLLVHPQSRRLHLVTKTEDGLCALYALPETMVQGQPMVLEKLVDLRFPARPHLGKRPHDACQTVSGGFSPDGRRLAIATYSFIHEWALRPGDSLAVALQRSALVIEPPLTRQMEAVCYDLDNETLWFTSERLPTPLYRLQR